FLASLASWRLSLPGAERRGGRSPEINAKAPRTPRTPRGRKREGFDGGRALGTNDRASRTQAESISGLDVLGRLGSLAVIRARSVNAGEIARAGGPRTQRTASRVRLDTGERAELRETLRGGAWQTGCTRSARP